MKVLDGLVLNSPWLNLQGSPALAAVVRPLLQQLSRSRATAPLPIRDDEERIYARATHSNFGGEWTYDVALSPTCRGRCASAGCGPSWPGTSGSRRGSGSRAPSSSRPARRPWLRRYAESARENDTVLDIDKIAAAATHLGRHLTLVRIPGAVHDIMLSRTDVRDDFMGEVARWAKAYLPD